MKIAAITHFKHGVLFEALAKLKWTQVELAARCKVSPITISNYMNLKASPSPEIARRIQDVLGEAGLFVDVEKAWPEKFQGFSKRLVVTDVREVDDHAILDTAHTGLSQFSLGEAAEVNGVSVPMLEDAMSKRLTDREKLVISGRFYEGKTLEQVGSELGVTREATRCVEEKALKKLRRHFEWEDRIEPLGEACRNLDKGSFAKVD